ncbi:hypothetical protein KQQSB11_380072 [Klebsiella quasipneumoniae subsp. quasipneumoniae]|nr:hypothetical protein KQQSB11_380072 [Klebsiella quasipneumoniae subsp. quasipneumoniae]
MPPWRSRGRKGLFSAARKLACWCLPSSARCRSLTPRRSTLRTRSTLCSLQNRRQRREDLRQTLLQVRHEGVDQRRSRAMERADQADGKRHFDAEAAHHHAAIGIVQGGQRVNHRDPGAGAHHGADRGRAVGFDHHPPLDLMLKEQGVEQLAIAVGARQADVVLALKIGGGQRRLRRQRMAGGQDADFIQRQQRGAFSARGGMQGLRQAKVMALGGEPLLQQRRLLGDDLQADLRVAGEERRQQQRQKGLGKDRQTGYRQLALAELAQALGGADDAVQAVPGTLNLLKQAQALHGWLQATAGPFKQPQAEHLLKARQLAADGGLGGMQHPRGFGQVAGGHHRMKDFDMAQIDGWHAVSLRLGWNYIIFA